MFLAGLRLYSQQISTANKKIEQIYLQYLHVFPSLVQKYKNAYETFIFWALCNNCRTKYNIRVNLASLEVALLNIALPISLLGGVRF